jgi:hypothetical protein
MASPVSDLTYTDNVQQWVWLILDQVNQKGHLLTH